MPPVVPWMFFFGYNGVNHYNEQRGNRYQQKNNKIHG
jgi:hypothetical protein